MTASTTITLNSRAWHGDTPITLDFPVRWDIAVHGPQAGPTMTPAAVRDALLRPIGAPALRELAAGKHRAALIVDDLTRPTPAALILPFLIDELCAAGLSPESIVVVLAGGTHAPASASDIAQKTGALPPGIRAVAHDSTRDLIDCGRTRRGLPLFVNREVMACDLKIGVGCIYPHPAAGFSGGSKILVPGVCGMETVRAMHDDLQSAERRGGSLASEMRQELEDVSARLGMNWIVNGLLNEERGLAELVAGDPIEAHRAGVARAKLSCSVPPPADADVVVADMYPFDADLQFAADRGLWPLLSARRGASRVILAACPRGIGHHSLYPVQNAFVARVLRRLSRLRLRDLRRPLEKVRNAAKLLTQGNVPVLALAPGLSDAELATVFKRASRFSEWRNLRTALEQRHSATGVKVALYRCAPLLLPH